MTPPPSSCRMGAMAKEINPFYRVMDRAYIRDGRVVHTDEAMMLACLVHSAGKGRKGKDMEDVQRIMRDRNRNVKKHVGN